MLTAVVVEITTHVKRFIDQAAHLAGLVAVLKQQGQDAEDLVQLCRQADGLPEAAFRSEASS